MNRYQPKALKENYIDTKNRSWIEFELMGLVRNYGHVNVRTAKNTIVSVDSTNVLEAISKVWIANNI